MCEEKISIIIPVYNSARYLSNCLKSVQSQTYQNFEVILVNDGSTDASEKIMQHFVRNDSRFCYYNSNHLGVSVARNIGISRAEGKYYAFIDSDDSVSKYFLETLFLLINKYNADLAVCGFEHTKEIDKKSDTKRYLRVKVMSGRNMLLPSKELFAYENSVVLWNKLYRAESWDTLRFLQGRIYEDAAVMYQLLYKTPRVAYTDRVLYFYNTKSIGVTRAKYTISQLDEVKAAKERMIYFYGVREKELYFAARKQYCILLLKHDYYLFKHFGCRQREQKLIRIQERRYLKGAWKKKLRISEKGAFLVASFAPVAVGMGIHYYDCILNSIKMGRIGRNEK